MNENNKKIYIVQSAHNNRVNRSNTENRFRTSINKDFIQFDGLRLD